MRKTEGSDIYYSPKNVAIIQKWKGVISHEIFQETIYHTIDLIKIHGALFIISDTKNSKKVTQTELNWLISDIDSILLDIGLKSLIFIITGSGLAKKGIQYYQDNSILDIQICKNMREAEKIIDKINKGD